MPRRENLLPRLFTPAHNCRTRVSAGSTESTRMRILLRTIKSGFL